MHISSEESLTKELVRLVDMEPRNIGLARADTMQVLGVDIGGPWMRILFYPNGSAGNSEPLVYVPIGSSASSPVVYFRDGLQRPIHHRWLTPTRKGIEVVVDIFKGHEPAAEFVSYLAEVTNHRKLCDEAWAQTFPDEWAKRASFWKPSELPKLAGREDEIQQLLSEDMPREKIAQLFGIGPGTLAYFTDRMNERHDNS